LLRLYYSARLDALADLVDERSEAGDQSPIGAVDGLNQRCSPRLAAEHGFVTLAPEGQVAEW
jgi:hypothetical protein